MLHLKQIIKSILKNKASSALSVLSLVISFTGIIILLLYISFEVSFDSFHKNKDSIYRVETLMYESSLPAALGEIIKTNVSEIEDIVVLSFDGTNNLSTPNLSNQNIAFSTKVMAAQKSFFTIFSFPLERGNPETALTEPYSIVISSSLAKKLFGDGNPLGESIIHNKELFTVSGVMSDFPKNSSFRADCILSFATKLMDEDSDANSWGDWSYDIFAKISPAVGIADVGTKMNNLPDLPEFFEEFEKSYPEQEFFQLTPLSDIHFKAGNYNYNYLNTNPTVLKVLVLLIAVLAIMGIVNFINFTTAQAPLRAKAISIFQVLGGRRSASVLGMIGESIFISIVSMLISLALFTGIYRYIESLFDIYFAFVNVGYVFVIGFILFAIIYGIIAGLYPSLYVTSSPISQTLKGAAYFKNKNKNIRNSLIIFQFALTIVLITSSLFIEKQLHYWNNYDIGFDKDHVVYLNTSEEITNHLSAFNNELLKNNNISDYAYSQFIPGEVGMEWGREVEGQFVQFKVWPIDDRFLDFFGIQINSGRKFITNSIADNNTFIVNEKAVEIFGWQNPLEATITSFGDEGRIVGVAKNFNFSSLKSEVKPMAFWRTDTRKQAMFVRIKPINIRKTIEQIKLLALHFDPTFQGEVKFLDQKLQEQYVKEEKIARFIEFVALWCILIALTGVLGLAFFVSKDRTKEIGIRKVNGAAISEILILLNRDFVKWVLIAFIIATPIAWCAMHRWLQNFAYKTVLSWWIFALAGLLALGVALVTVSFQSWKAATKNPVQSLRYE